MIGARSPIRYGQGMIPSSTYPTAVIVAGPTASGKSALALALAEHLSGTIVNADSMQVYQDLRVLTARPTEEEEARVPHLLYGTVPASRAGSVASWRDAALDAMRAVHAAGRLPILTGGTGLYFASLTEGLAAVPDPGPDARAEARALLTRIGAEAMHAGLVKVDPATAHRIKPMDGQRVARAWEVWSGTGRGLAAWQQERLPPAPWAFRAIRLDPPRDDLRSAIAQRFSAMLRAGAIGEVEALLAQGLDPALPAMRAHGVPELSAYLRGDIDLAEAERRATLVTGQYTKRQATWFRHHALAQEACTITIHARISDNSQLSERNIAESISFIENMA